MAKLPLDGSPPQQQRIVMTIEEAVDYVVQAIDTKMRKVLFPHKLWYSHLIRPIVPDYVDTRLYTVAKL